LRNVRDRLAGHDRQGERRIDQRAFEFRFCRIGMVEMDGIGIHGQESKPNIIGIQHRATQSMPIDISDLEVFKNPSGPTFFDCQGYLPRTVLVGI
jgi:hypothetical protein